MSTLSRIDLRGLVLPVGLLLAGEIAARVSNLHSDSLAAPSEVLVAGFYALADGSLLTSTYETLASAAAGLAIGFFLGLFIGVFLGLFRPLDRLLEVTIEAIRPVPSVALIPIALLVYGFGYRMEIAVIAFATVWPALVLTRAAIASVEPRLFEVSRVMELSLPDSIFKIVIPAALPRIFVALRLGIGISLIVAVTVEISANTIGLGHAMMEAGQTLRPALMLADLVWVGILGFAVNWLMLAAQKHLFGPAANVETRL